MKLLILCLLYIVTLCQPNEPQEPKEAKQANEPNESKRSDDDELFDFVFLLILELLKFYFDNFFDKPHYQQNKWGLEYKSEQSGWESQDNSKQNGWGSYFKSELLYGWELTFKYLFAIIVVVVIIVVVIIIIRFKKIKKQKELDNIPQKRNLDELRQILNGIANQLEKVNFELTYKFNGLQIKSKVESVQVSQQNKDKLTFQFNGSDKYGIWVQKGGIDINKKNQIEISSRKIYNRTEIHRGDVLMYDGEFDDQVDSFKGRWYYVKSKVQGEWTLLFNNKK